MISLKQVWLLASMALAAPFICLWTPFVIALRALRPRCKTIQYVSDRGGDSGACGS